MKTIPPNTKTMNNTPTAPIPLALGRESLALSFLRIVLESDDLLTVKSFFSGFNSTL